MGPTNPAPSGRESLECFMTVVPEHSSQWAWRGGSRPHFTALCSQWRAELHSGSLGPLDMASRPEPWWPSFSCQGIQTPRQILSPKSCGAFYLNPPIYPRAQQDKHCPTRTRSVLAFIPSPASQLSPVPFLGLPAPD